MKLVLPVAAMIVVVPIYMAATTIVPYVNLGALTERCDALVIADVVQNFEHIEGGQTFFRTRLIVNENIKGDLQIGEQFDVQKWEKLIDDKWMTMWGDLNLYENTRYLFFLEKKGEDLYHPICFSYYVFEEISMDGEVYLVPSEHSVEFEELDLKNAEPLFIYRKDPLIGELTAAAHKIKKWESEHARTDLTISDFAPVRNDRAAPTGCTYLFAGSKKIRWTGFPDQNVGIHYNVNGAIGCSSSVSDAQLAISALQNAYPGINVYDAGTVPDMADCSLDMSALGSDYRNYIDQNFGSYRHIIIQYDDPCGEIANLSNCAGILAIGGVYGIGSHDHEGESWATGKYGYVVLNNGFGACKCSGGGASIALQQTLSHEISHALGLGHISASYGSANMNPSCCNAITSVDQNCFNYSYPTGSQGSILPIELVSFTGKTASFKNQLSWKTSFESNVDKFVVERTTRDAAFEAIGDVRSKGDTHEGHEYNWIDYHPEPENFYRLKSIDLDGTVNYSQIIQMSGESISKPIVFPTITSDVLQVRLPKSAAATLQVNSAKGQLIDQRKINENDELSVRDLPSGWYYLHLSNDLYSETYRFFRSE